jgi:ABC-type amino acid transport substrate-binding protein
MYARPWSIFTFACAALLATSDAGAGAAVTLRTAAQLQSEPKFVGGEAHGRQSVQGLCVDIFRAIERQDGDLAFSGDQTWSPPARIDANLDAGQLDVACGLVRNERRSARLTALEPPLFALHYVLLSRAEDPATVTGWNDIIRMRDNNVVLAMQGTGPSRQLAEIAALPVDAGSASVRQNLQKLMMGRGRFFYYRLPALNPVIREYCAQRKIKVLPAVMRAAPAYLMVGRHVPADVQLRLRGAIRKLKDSGELDQLIRKWGVNDSASNAC